MSVSELNQFMTYVLEGWMLFSAGFVSMGFISFATRRIQEDLEAEALALAQTASTAEDVTEGVTEVDVEVSTAVNTTISADVTPKISPEAAVEAVEAAKESARLEEVAAVSEQLAKAKGKQSDTSSVSVST